MSTITARSVRRWQEKMGKRPRTEPRAAPPGQPSYFTKGLGHISRRGKRSNH